jgi:hypothetical protein
MEFLAVVAELQLETSYIYFNRCLFNDAVNISDCIVPIDRLLVHNEMEGRFYRGFFRGGTEERHEKCKSG